MHWQLARMTFNSQQLRNMKDSKITIACVNLCTNFFILKERNILFSPPIDLIVLELYTYTYAWPVNLACEEWPRIGRTN